LALTENQAFARRESDELNDRLEEEEKDEVERHLTEEERRDPFSSSSHLVLPIHENNDYDYDNKV